MLELSTEVVTNLLLASLFITVIASNLVLKMTSHQIDPRTAPAFICVWVLIGLLAVFPVYGHLLLEGVFIIQGMPWLLLLLIGKGVLLWLLFDRLQHLNKLSLSARKYTLPTAIGLLVFTNGIFGERLEPIELIAAFGLCALGVGFALRGHLYDLPPHGKLLFLWGTLLIVACGTLDHIILSHLNWYTLLLITNIVLLVVIGAMQGGLGHIKISFTSLWAVAGGALFSIQEILKFYQSVTYSPVTVVLTVQAASIPVLLLLSSFIWQERSWREQLLWGISALALIVPVIMF